MSSTEFVCDKCHNLMAVDIDWSQGTWNGDSEETIEIVLEFDDPDHDPNGRCDKTLRLTGYFSRTGMDVEFD